jgi:hypothetical protein
MPPITDDDAPDEQYHIRLAALHSKDVEITRSAGLPANPCGCESCNFVRRSEGLPEVSGSGTRVKRSKLPLRSKSATKGQQGDTPMSKPPAHLRPLKAEPSAGSKSKAKAKTKPKAKTPPAKRPTIPRFEPSIRQRKHGIMFRLSDEEMALVIEDATKHKDRSISSAMRRRLGFQ